MASSYTFDADSYSSPTAPPKTTSPNYTMEEVEPSEVTEEVESSEVTEEVESGYEVDPDFIHPVRGGYFTGDDPADTGEGDAFSTLYLPSALSAPIDFFGGLMDLPGMLIAEGAALGADALGFEDVAEYVRTKQGFAKPEEGTLTHALRLGLLIPKPRAPLNENEAFLQKFFYGVGSIPIAPAFLAGRLAMMPKAARAALITQSPAREGTRQLTRALNKRGPDTALAQAAFSRMKNASLKGANAKDSFKTGLRVFLDNTTREMLTKPVRFGLLESLAATGSGVGMGLPQYMTDEEGRLMVGSGPNAFEVPVVAAETVGAALGSMAVFFLPRNLAFQGVKGAIKGAADDPNVKGAVAQIPGRLKVLKRSLFQGMSEEGREILAARILNEVGSTPGAMDELLKVVSDVDYVSPTLPLVRSVNPKTGEVSLKFAGVELDTPQLLKVLGMEDTRLAALDHALGSKGHNVQLRLAEAQRRSEALDEVFDTLRSDVAVGDEAVLREQIKRVGEMLDQDAIEALRIATRRAAEAYDELKNVIGRDKASELARGMIDEARREGRVVQRKLWSEEALGTKYVAAKKLGDWAAERIRTEGRTAENVPGMGEYYKLAGTKRLNEIDIGQPGRPLEQADVRGVSTADSEKMMELNPLHVGEAGSYDKVDGAIGSMGRPVTIKEMDDYRGLLNKRARGARERGNAELGKLFSDIINHIDEVILTSDNIAVKGNLSHIRNLKIARAYSKSHQERYGANSEIGNILYKGDPNRVVKTEGFLSRLIKPGPEAGKRVELFNEALNSPVLRYEFRRGGKEGKWVYDKNAADTINLEGGPNVIEAELLGRFTEAHSHPVTSRQVDNFLKKYKLAVDKVEGLEQKFRNIEELQKAVHVAQAKMTAIPRKKVIDAMQKHNLTEEDVLTAQTWLDEDFTDRRLAQVASDYLEVDVNQAVKKLLDDTDAAVMGKKADEMASLVAKGGPDAEAGMRAALWRYLRDKSLRTELDVEGNPLPGIDTQKYIAAKEKVRPVFEKFFDENSMKILDDLGVAGPFQKVGTDILFPKDLTVAEVMSRDFGTAELIKAGGRSSGQKVFGLIGINPLVATGMGGRASAYFFGTKGQDAVLKLVEDALRKPSKAAALVKKYKALDEWKPPEKLKETFQEISDDPALAAKYAKGAAKTGKETAVTSLNKIVEFAQNHLKNYTAEAIRRGIRFGLLPAQAALRARPATLEKDYEMGPPFYYEENRLRYEEEQKARSRQRMPDQSFVPPVTENMTEQVSPARRYATIPERRERSPYVMLGRSSPETIARGQQLFGASDPIFSAKNGGYINAGADSGMGRLERSKGILSIKRKGRQLVG